MLNKITYLLLFVTFATTVARAQRLSPNDTTTEHTVRGTFYHDRFVGRKTSSGEVFRQDLYTAAHRHIKFGTLLLVTNPKNGKQVIVKINDRCPKDRIIDMTRLAAKTIEIKSSSVKIKILPSYYKEIWEKQSELGDVLSEGSILEYASHYFANKHRKQEPADTDKKNKDSNKHLLYDIELAKGKHLDTEDIISNLPIYYQDKVGISDSAGDRGKTIILFLSLPNSEASKILLSLKAKFPNATLIPSK